MMRDDFQTTSLLSSDPIQSEGSLDRKGNSQAALGILTNQITAFSSDLSSFLSDVCIVRPKFALGMFRQVNHRCSDLCTHSA